MGKNLRVTVIGGGTGNFVLLSGLKKYKNLSLTAIVPSTDSGGSTGRLRDEFGFLPIGDIRQCLVALSQNSKDEVFLRELFNYRFDKGDSGLKGHNFGNILLTVLTDIVKDELKAIKLAQKLLKIKGSVLPVTLEKCELCAEYENGKILKGEHLIDQPEYPHDGRLRIIRLFTQPNAKTYLEVKNKILESDIIILGPGDLYTSIIANLVVDGVCESLRKSKAKIFYNVNLVTKYAQTYGFTAKDHVRELETYIGRDFDYILVNNSKLPKDILERYKLQNDFVVKDNLGAGDNIIRDDFLAEENIITPAGDLLKRSLIRHDSSKLIAKILSIFDKS